VRRVIRGVPKAKDENLSTGLGGTFSYFKLGKPLRLRAILEGSALPDYESLASYVFFTATGEEFDAKRIDKKTWFIGESRHYDVFLLYEQDTEKLKQLALTLDLARALPSLSGKPKLVFAPTKYLDPYFLDRLRLTFQQLSVSDLQGAGDLTMQLKAYQTRTLETLRFNLEQLAEMKIKAAKARELDLDIDFAVDAWKKTPPTRTYFPRRNGLGEPLPSICLKIPTGGGKTLLATHAVDLVNLHIGKSKPVSCCGSFPRLRFTTKRWPRFVTAIIRIAKFSMLRRPIAR
jgi:hypothetical protein